MKKRPHESNIKLGRKCLEDTIRKHREKVTNIRVLAYTDRTEGGFSLPSFSFLEVKNG